jgi:hypothetical protein
MSRQYDRYERTTRRTAFAGPRRTGLGHWIPLALTVAVATVGLAAWIWSERQEDDEEEDDQDGTVRPGDGNQPVNYPPGSYSPGGYPAAYPPGAYVPPNYSTGSYGQPSGEYPPPPIYGVTREGDPGFYGATTQSNESSSYVARMSGALKRAPSPQQILEGATRTVSAGVGAVGAVVGNALSSIREEDRNAFRDHKTWSEEAEARVSGAPATTRSLSQRAAGSASNGKRKIVAVVISADADNDGLDDGGDYYTEHAVRTASSMERRSTNFLTVNPITSASQY